MLTCALLHRAQELDNPCGATYWTVQPPMPLDTANDFHLVNDHVTLLNTINDGLPREHLITSTSEPVTRVAIVGAHHPPDLG